MASACVNNMGMSPENFPPKTYQSYGWLSPRISFSREEDSNNTTTSAKSSSAAAAAAAAAASSAPLPPPHPQQLDPPETMDSVDFEFRLDNSFTMLPADELFSDGKLMPLQINTGNGKPSLPPSTSTSVNELTEAVRRPEPGREPVKSCRRLEMEISGTDPYLFSPKAPRCSSRWKELLGLKKLHQNPKPETQKPSTRTALFSSSSSNPKSLKHILHRNSKTCNCNTSSSSSSFSYTLLDHSLSLPLLRDLDCESLSISSSRLSLSSSSSSHEHEDLPRLSLDSDKPSSNLNLMQNPGPNPFILNRNQNQNPPRMRMVKPLSENGNNSSGTSSTARVGRSTNLVSFPEKDSNNTIDAEPSNAGRPIKFIYYDESGKFKVHPDAVDALMQIKGPIGVVSVCGRARQGKSFLLNQLLGRSTGFQVGSTHRPCTKGIWIWSEPLKRVALGGTEYSLVLLDCEGIDAYDQTGTYSAQIFSLAILLSSLFVYNQMGVIDEAALDCLSLVSEMTKHIHVKASGEKETVPDLGHFSPVFVWLLRDFYLDLKEDNTKITPCNYLELALRPVLGSRKDVAARNKIRESIRALFPNRECFTLVSPLNNEADLQHLDRVLLDKYRPEFLSGLNMLAKFVFERTKPKQVGGTVMTGPILVGITKSFLDSLNRGAVPTISSSWQNVEESECQKAFNTAIEVYMSAFDRTKPVDEVSLREVHDEAVQKSISVYNASAVGVGSARQKYEVLLQNFCKKAFEDYKRNEFIEADIQCLNAIQNMERKLKAACQVDDAKIERVVIVLDSLLSEYEASVHGPAKWQKLSSFLQQSLQGPILHHAKKLIDEASSDKNVLVLKCCSMEDKMQMLHKKLEASEKFKTEYRKSYEDAINDLNKVSECYKSRITDLERKCSSLEERYSSSLEMLDSAKQESLEWRRKYEETWNKKAVKDQVKVGTMSGAHEAEARLAASHGQTQLAWKKADEWKEKYVIAVNEFKANIEKENVLLEYPIEDVNCREEALSAELCNSLAEKQDKEIKVKIAKLEEAEQKITTLNLDLKGAQEKMDKYELELSALKLQLKNLTDKYESVKTVAHALEMQAHILVQDGTKMEQKYLTESKRFEEANERCKVTAEEVKVANKFVETAQSDVLAAQNSKWDASQLAIERLAQMETAQKQIEDLERQKVDLTSEVDRLRISEVDAISRVALLEAMVKERDQELEALKMKCEQRLSSMLGQNIMANEPSLHAEQQRELVSPQVELSPDHSNETALVSEMETIAWGKRSRLKVLSAGQDSVQDMDIDEEIARESKKQKMALQKCTTTEVENSDVKANEDSEDRKAGSRSYVRLTVLKMQQELTELGFGGDLLELKSSKKKDVYALYKRLVLKK